MFLCNKKCKGGNNFLNAKTNVLSNQAIKLELVYFTYCSY